MLVKIHPGNHAVFDRLVQDYEEEFSPITGKNKNEEGKYPLDSSWEDPSEGYYWIRDGKEVGFCILGKLEGYWDIFEFYVIPSCRNQGIGETMAHTVFKAHPGKWQVRQIEGADKAKAFWRKAIGSFTSDQYKEVELKDPYWGPVTCQRFETSIEKSHAL